MSVKVLVLRGDPWYENVDFKTVLFRTQCQEQINQLTKNKHKILLEIWHYSTARNLLKDFALGCARIKLDKIIEDREKKYSHELDCIMLDLNSSHLVKKQSTCKFSRYVRHIKHVKITMRNKISKLMNYNLLMLNNHATTSCEEGFVTSAQWNCLHVYWIIFTKTL